MDSGTYNMAIVRFCHNLAYLASPPVDLASCTVRVIHSSLTVSGRLEYCPECRSCNKKITPILFLKFNIRSHTNIKVLMITAMYSIYLPSLCF